ncbi:hypothetical protein KFK09_014994 [Dendrobium nobile]|uniref:Uncharacterized protein n=1 Tax=Dendrobium nobile TaxID=94219 RepID=A0A8T3B394_DENNO|nr:hypothetical protein KFK09_014994 [Dendrobium nobile]
MSFLKSINRAPSPLEKGPLSLRREIGDCSCFLASSTTVEVSPDHHRSSAGPPPEALYSTGPPPNAVTPPDHHLTPCAPPDHRLTPSLRRTTT